MWINALYGQVWRRFLCIDGSMANWLSPRTGNIRIQLSDANVTEQTAEQRNKNEILSWLWVKYSVWRKPKRVKIVDQFEVVILCQAALKKLKIDVMLTIHLYFYHQVILWQNLVRSSIGAQPEMTNDDLSVKENVGSNIWQKFVERKSDEIIGDL